MFQSPQAFRGSLPQVVCSGAFGLLWLWLIAAFFKQRRRRYFHAEEIYFSQPRGRKSAVFTVLVVISNVVVTGFHLGCLAGHAWKHRGVPLELALYATTWVIATTLAVRLRLRVLEGTDQNWPLVLNFWWFLFFLVDVSSIVFIVGHLHWLLLPLPGLAIYACLPFSGLLCLSPLVMKTRRSLQELRSPLLQKDDESIGINGYGNAGIWSKLTFRWLNKLLEAGRREKLELHHVPLVPDTETAENSFSSLQEALRKRKGEAPSLPNAIVFSIWKPLAINAAFAGLNTLSSYAGPFLITSFVNFLSAKGGNSNIHQGYMLAFIFLFAKTIESVSQRQWYFGAHQLGIRVRAALMVCVYMKSLSVRYGGVSNGKVVNLLNVDVERVGDFLWYAHGIWLLPIQVSLALIILYKNLGGAASAAAFAATVLVMVSNTPLANLQERLHTKIMEAKDSRIKATSETLKSMRVLKLHSWETIYLNKLLELRKVERNWLKRYLYTCSAVAFLFWASPTLVSVFTFGVCMIVKMPLVSGTVLSALATFRILQDPIYNLPELVSMMAQTKVSIDRIQQFLMKEDQKKLIYNINPKEPEVAIDMEVAEYAWTSDSDSNKPAVRISEKIKIMRGEKVAVCGSVGSGKSSLLCSIIGEIPRINGTAAKVYGSKAYVPQSAWIQTGSVRDNVLFGKKMDIGLYQEVVEGCALDRDVEMWADGDLTMIGERGMNLSGGQKQRIQLARAIYSDSDVYLLDDPFSAVDAHTGAHLFKKCLSGLLADKTAVYVTHQLEFIDSSDLVLVMRDGDIVQSGKYDDLIKDSDGELVRQMAAHNTSLNQVTPPQGTSLSSSTPQQLQESELTEEKPHVLTSRENFTENFNEEERESGRVKWSVYSTFITLAYKGALVPVVLLCQILFQGLQMGSNYWIAWGTEKEGRVSNEKLIGVFVLLSAGSSAFILGRAVLLSTIAIETSRRLFRGMIKCVFRAPISFFDKTPSSRILNRCSTDQSTVDTDIPYRLAGLAFALIQLLSIIILMSQVAWQVFILFIIVLALSVWYQAYYITTARELARMVGIKKAPILHHFSQSISGATTIRCFNQEDHFHSKVFRLIDDYSRIAFHNSATMEWLCVRVNLLFNLVFFALLVILVTIPRSSLDPSLAGLAATYGLNLNVLQAWVIWNLCNVENKMISIERILQFSNIPSEAPLVIEDRRPDITWPQNGTIELDNLCVQYSPGLPMVLQDITCVFPGQKKIGIVGRTGSGKSTLIQSLFRVVEPTGGRILVDGVNICKMGLQDLRSRLSIIPQDPILFQGNIRTNLDPLEQVPDADIWEALNKCRLGDIVRQDQRLLDAPVAEDGENWSVGQRQLLCLARVLLKKRKILVLDEATASVDTETDNLIQKTIREEARDCTVITVAHRIPTVIDNDLVLVLDEGKNLEFDSPNNLLCKKSSAFSKLVMEFLKRSNADRCLG